MLFQMPLIYSFLLAVLVLNLRFTQGQSPLESSRLYLDLTTLSVIEPQDLKINFDQIKSKSLSVANFGHIPWGQAFKGDAFMSNPPDGCSSITLGVSPSSNVNSIAIIDRGGCPLDQKVLNAQLIGAKGVIIVNNQAEQNINQFIIEEQQQEQHIYIPAVMIDKASGDAIKNKLSNDSSGQVTLAIDFKLPKSSEKTKVELWIAGIDQCSFELVDQMQWIKQKLHDAVDFSFHPVTTYCLPCARAGYSNVILNPACVSSGRYCSPIYPNLKNTSTNGSQALLEDLRRICLFNQSEELLWKYFANFNRSCLKDNSLENCSHQTMNAIGANQTAVDDCVKDSFSNGTVEDSDNKIFAREKSLMLERGVRAWPSVYINQQMYKGEINTTTLLGAICGSFQSVPAECFPEIIPFGRPTIKGEKDWKWVAIIGSIAAAVTIVFLVLLIFCKNHPEVRRDVVEKEILMTSMDPKIV